MPELIKGILKIVGSGSSSQAQVVPDEGPPIDLKPLLFAVFKNAHGKTASQEIGDPRSYSFTVDATARYRVSYSEGEDSTLLIAVEGKGRKNPIYYLNEVVRALTAQMVIVEIGKEDFSIRAEM